MSNVNVMPDCFPKGTCTKKHLVMDFELEARCYDLSESRLIRALIFEAARMISGGYMTVIPNVKDKQRLFREEFDFSFQSTANGGRAKDACGHFQPKGKYTNFDKCIETSFMHIDAAVCYKKLIGTFKQNLLRAGAGFSHLNDSLNETVLAAIIRDANIQTDKLIWHGDYGSGIDEISHYDGLLKKVALAANSVAPAEVKITFSIVDGQCIEGKLGGEAINVPFDTDIPTTGAALAAAIAAVCDPLTGAPLYTTQFVAPDCVAVVANKTSYPIDLHIGISNCDGKIAGCDNGVDVGASFLNVDVISEVCDVACDSPMTIPYSQITVANVLDVLEGVYLKVADERPWLLEDPNFTVHVSNHVWSMLRVALTKQTAAVNGIGSLQSVQPFGLNVVRQPYLQGNVVFGAQSTNLFFGTDLESDLSNVESWIEQSCQEVRMRLETSQGVEIGSLCDVISNVDCAPFKFATPLQGANCKPC